MRVSRLGMLFARRPAMHSSFNASVPNSGLLDDVSAIVWEADPTTFQFLYVSRAAEKLLGYSLEEWLSRPTFWVDLLHPDDRESAVAHCRAAVEQCRDHDFQYRVITADRSVRWLRDIVTVRCGDSGQVERLCGLMIDVTAAPASDPGATTATTAQAFDRIALEHGVDIIVISDADGTIRYVTPSVEAVLGYPQTSRFGRSVFELVHPDDLNRMKAIFVSTLATGDTSTAAQVRCRHANGTWR